MRSIAWPSFLRSLAILAGVVGVLGACQATRPDMGRIPAEDFADIEEELVANADEYCEAVEEAGLLFEDPEFRTYLQDLVDEMLVQERRSAGEVRVVLLDNPFGNASIFPNGTLHFHIGMASQIENEAQLVALLGHELTHFLNRHAVADRIYRERAETQLKSTRLMASLVLLPLGLSPLAFNDISVKGIDGILAPQLAGFSQDQERESDRGGLLRMAALGYDPSHAAGFFEMLMADVALTSSELNRTEVEDPYYYASHPALEERRDSMRAIAAERDRTCLEPAPDPRWACGVAAERVGVEAYRARIARVGTRNAELDRAIRTLERLLEYNEDDAEAWALLGEIRGGRGGRGASLGKAIEALERAVAIDDERASAFRELGFLYSSDGRSAESDSAFRRFLELSPDAPDRALIEKRLHGER